MEKRHLSSRVSDSRLDWGRIVPSPVRHEGIGNALRVAFDPGNYGLPADLAKLVSKLDR